MCVSDQASWVARPARTTACPSARACLQGHSAPGLPGIAVFACVRYYLSAESYGCALPAIYVPMIQSAVRVMRVAVSTRGDRRCGNNAGGGIRDASVVWTGSSCAVYIYHTPQAPSRTTLIPGPCALLGLCCLLPWRAACRWSPLTLCVRMLVVRVGSVLLHVPSWGCGLLALGE